MSAVLFDETITEARPCPVELWLLNPADLAALEGRAEALLSGPERAQGDRLPDPAARGLWLGRQVALRLVLAEHLGMPPEKISLAKGAGGKPALALPRAPHFSVSASGGWWLAAVSDQQVGVDIEAVRPLPDFESVARHWFNGNEMAYFEALRSEEERLRCFYRCWTRKEALLKLRGDGLAGLDALRSVEAFPGAWVEELELQEGLAASLALQRPPSFVRRRLLAERSLGPAKAAIPGAAKAPGNGASEPAADGQKTQSAYLFSEVSDMERDRLRQQASFWLALELPSILETLPKTGRFLDLGCGMGLLADAVAEACPDAEVWGFDADASAVEQSRRTFGGRPGLGFGCRRAEDGPPEGFPLADVAVMRLVLMHLPDPAAALQAVKKWLKPGGILHILEGDDRDMAFEPSPSWLPGLLSLMQGVQQERGGSRHLGRDLPGLLESAGWSILGDERIALDPCVTASALPKVFLPVAEFYVNEAERLGFAGRQKIQVLKEGLEEVKKGLLTRVSVPLFHAWGQVTAEKV